MNASIRILLVVMVCLPARGWCATAALQRDIATKGRSEAITVAFPDVCITPTSAPVPVSYPNLVSETDSDFEAGKYPLKDGGAIEIEDSQFSAPAATASAKEPGGVTASKLLELADGTYCAICVEKNRITRILKLRPLKQRQSLPQAPRKNSDTN